MSHFGSKSFETSIDMGTILFPLFLTNRIPRTSGEEYLEAIQISQNTDQIPIRWKILDDCTFMVKLAYKFLDNPRSNPKK